MTPLSRIEALLNQSFGLDVASIGHAAFERAVQQRMAACESRSVEVYWEHLRASKDELQELTEALVVPETWFFRDPESFEAMVQLASERPRRPLRLLSLPCATGEEAYSMAMALLDAGMPPADFTIDAADISRHALDRARRAEYGRNAFRSPDLGYRDRYFHLVEPGRYRLDEQVRRAVRWHQANLFASTPIMGLGGHDVVFCRNLLIYFDRPMQERALAVLKGLLAPDGLLFVGPSEAPLLLALGFEWLKMPKAFGFRQATVPPVQAPAPQRALQGARPPTRAPAPVSSPPPPSPPSPPRAVAALVPAADTTISEQRLKHAAQLANQGRLDEAEQLCQEHLRQQASCAQARYLLGLIHDARGQTDRAGECYRSALYLDPEHEQALLHLALLRERQGDAAGAQRLHERARRVQAPSPQRPK